jgi:hypothetical protein
MTPEPQKTDWSKIANVFKLIEDDGRQLTIPEKRLIAGQRKINLTLFQAIDAVLKTFPDESAPPAIIAAKGLLKDLPGQEPPGCGQDFDPD